jgi:predicted AlkP superfamily pyrophosphatase or phosphodiesterase
VIKDSCHGSNFIEKKMFCVSAGGHGYDPNKVPKMHPFFIASGPAFKKGFVSEAFDMVDIYPLMCYVLGIKPAPNNGTLENVRQLLASPPPPPSKESSIPLTVIPCKFLIIL